MGNSQLVIQNILRIIVIMYLKVKDTSSNNKTSSFRISFVTIILFLLTFISNGCSRQIHVFEFYNGQKRPLEELAVLMVDETIYLHEVDGNHPLSDPDDALISPECKFHQEIHLLPGEHTLMIGYSYGRYRSIRYSNLSEDFEAGKVYKLSGIISTWKTRDHKPLFRKQEEIIEPAQYAPSIEVVTFREFAQENHDCLPDHWSRYKNLDQ